MSTSQMQLFSVAAQRTTLKVALILQVTAWAAVMLSPTMASAQSSQSPWLAAQDVQSQLAAGKVVSRTQLDQQHASAQIDAAIRMNAAPQDIWKLLTECKSASIYISGLKGCRVINSAADGSWDVIEHDIKYSALLPLIHSVYRADYQPLQRIDFHGVSGDMKDEIGMWILRQSADHSVTVEYRVSIRPGFWVPQSMIQRSLKKQLPASLMALRARAEQMTATAASAANPAVALASPSADSGP